ncbi:MAG: helix-turn-helix domain-containing protein [Opitutaceae bacterium]|jgi:AraC-like DNA-binding protein
MASTPAPVSFDPSRPDFEPYGLTCVHWSPSKMLRPDHHNEVELNFLESGTVTYLLGGRKVTLTAAHLGVFWAAVPHQIIDFGDEPSYFVATIPLPWFLQWRLPSNLTAPLLAGEFIVETSGRNARTDLQLFAQWESDLQQANPGLAKSVLLEMQARLVRLAPHFPARAAPRRSRKPAGSGLSKVEQMACFVARNYLERLEVQSIADVVGLHPNYAMNLFQKTLGSTLMDYMIKHRVAHAQRLLATTDAKINDVAAQSGFSSVSWFNIAFRKTCGCSPHKYRRSHRIDDLDSGESTE